MKGWLIWGGLLLAWTIALELPGPTPEGIPGGEYVITHKYYFAKTLHVVMFAMLTGWAGWLTPPVRYRRLLLLLLVAHAGATEVLQLVLEPYCHRGGSIEDVAFDQAGIFIGLLIAWHWWTRADK